MTTSYNREAGHTKFWPCVQGWTASPRSHEPVCVVSFRVEAECLGEELDGALRLGQLQQGAGGSVSDPEALVEEVKRRYDRLLRLHTRLAIKDWSTSVPLTAGA
jgi:hypothetical protein